MDSLPQETHKQNLARIFIGHGPQDVNGSQLSSLDLMERKGHKIHLAQFPVPLSTWDECPLQQSAKLQEGCTWSTEGERGHLPSQTNRLK